MRPRGSCAFRREDSREDFMGTALGLSERGACHTVRSARSAFYVPWRHPDDGPVIAAILGYLHDDLRRGFDKL